MMSRFVELTPSAVLFGESVVGIALKIVEVCPSITVVPTADVIVV